MSGEQAQRICDSIGFSGQLRVEARGFSGGIWLFWRSEIVNVSARGSHSQHISVEMFKVGEEPWLFSAIYASPDSTLRKELERIRESYKGPWVILMRRQA